MVLSGDFIEFLVINTYLSLDGLSLRYEIFPLIFHGNGAPFLRETLYQTYAFTVTDGVDDVYIEQLQYLSLHNVHHVGVESPLR